MIYSEAKTMIKSGDLLAWSSKSLVGRLIRFFTGHTYSHMGIAWVIDGGRVLVLEAREGRGVIIRPLSHSLPFYLIKSDNAKWSAETEQEALSLVDESYSYLDAFKGGLGIPTGKDDQWQCAEYCLRVLSLCGIELSPKKITPGEVVRDAMAKGATLYLIVDEKKAT